MTKIDREHWDYYQEEIWRWLIAGMPSDNLLTPQIEHLSRPFSVMDSTY